MCWCKNGRNFCNSTEDHWLIGGSRDFTMYFFGAFLFAETCQWMGSFTYFHPPVSLRWFTHFDPLFWVNFPCGLMMTTTAVIIRHFISSQQAGKVYIQKMCINIVLPPKNCVNCNFQRQCFLHSSCSYFGEKKHTVFWSATKLSILQLLLFLTAGPPDPLRNNFLWSHVDGGKDCLEFLRGLGNQRILPRNHCRFESLRRDFSNEQSQKILCKVGYVNPKKFGDIVSWLCKLWVGKTLKVSQKPAVFSGSKICLQQKTTLDNCQVEIILFWFFVGFHPSTAWQSPKKVGLAWPSRKIWVIGRYHLSSLPPTISEMSCDMVKRIRKPILPKRLVILEAPIYLGMDIFAQDFVPLRFQRPISGLRSEINQLNVSGVKSLPQNQPPFQANIILLMAEVWPTSWGDR